MATAQTAAAEKSHAKDFASRGRRRPTEGPARAPSDGPALIFVVGSGSGTTPRAVRFAHHALAQLRPVFGGKTGLGTGLN